LESDNWIAHNLRGALDTTNEELAEILSLLTSPPTEFKGGGVWNATATIHEHFRQSAWSCEAFDILLVFEKQIL
jgi:hypothetical protein